MKAIKRVSIIAVAISITVAMLLTGCGAESNKAERDAFSRINSVCEMATLKCYYHNVVRSENTNSSIAKLFGNFGYKKMWIEYSGIVNLGIQVGDVKVGQPDSKGNVKVTMPKAEILSVDLDKDSISTPIVTTGILTNINASEKAAALAEAQEKMQEQAKADKSLLGQAQTRAKSMIEGYIKNVGKQIGKDYFVEWVEE